MRQLLFQSNYIEISTSVVNYTPLAASGEFGAATTDAQLRNLIPLAGSLQNFRVNLTVAPGSGKSYTCRVLKNGTATGIEVVIANTDTTGVDTTHTTSVTAGDTFSIEITPSGTPAATRIRTAIVLDTGSVKDSIISPGGAGTSNSSLIGSGMSGWEYRVRNVIPVAGTLKNLYVKLGTAPGGGNSRTFTVYKNGSPTSLALTISGTNTAGSHTSDPVSLAAGDDISLVASSSGSPAATGSVNVGAVFESSVDHQYICSVSGINPLTTGSTQYAYLSGRGDINGGVFNQTQGLTRNLFDATAKIVGIRAKMIDAAPGSGKSWTFTLQKNGSDTGLACTISDTNTQASDTDSISLADGDLLETKIVPANSPTSSRASISYIIEQAVTLATVTTETPATEITSTSAEGGGNVTADGDGVVSERGIAWGTSINPTIAGDHQASGSGVGVFTGVPMTGLTPGTHYYYRAYAINEAGTAYGDNVEFDTLDAVISGVATNAGVPVEGAIITLIDSGTDQVVDTATTDVNGEYSFTGLDVTKTYHVTAEYADGYDLYNAKSLPFMTPEEV